MAPPSDELTIDLTNYKDRVGARVAPNTYRVQVSDVESTESQQKNPMINVWLRIIGGPFDGQTITDRLTLTDKSMFRVVGFMQAIGLPTPNKRLRINVQQFVGKKLDVEVADGEPYNGRIKSEVKGYLRIDTTNATPEDLADLDALDVPETDGSAVDLPDDEAEFAGDTETETVAAPAAAASNSTAADSAEYDDEVNLDDVDLT
jgi:hypothetical protein